MNLVSRIGSWVSFWCVVVSAGGPLGCGGDSSGVICGAGTTEIDGICAPAEAANGGAPAGGATGTAGRGGGGQASGGGTAGASGDAGHGTSGAAGANAGPSCSFPAYEWDGQTLAPYGVPTPGTCVGNTAVVCTSTGHPNTGILTELACSSGETCRTFEVAAWAPTSPSQAYAPLGSPLVWAACVPDEADASPVSFACSSTGAWVAAAGDHARCDGADRLAPVMLPVPAVRVFSSMPADDIPDLSVGTTSGYLARSPCGGGKLCAVHPDAGGLFCRDADASPCQRSRCDGDVLTRCENGFEAKAIDCAAEGGGRCFTSDESCQQDPVDHASCQPKGAQGCFPESFHPVCAAGGSAMESCSSQYCVVSRTSCTNGDVCHAVEGSVSCQSPNTICDPATYVAHCTGTVLSTCSPIGVSITADCAKGGPGLPGLPELSCATTSDVSAPGGVAAGCTFPDAKPCSPDAYTASCDGDRARFCCGAFGAPLHNQDGFACLEGFETEAACPSCSVNQPFGVFSCGASPK
jgi:hypothetical protein